MGGSTVQPKIVDDDPSVHGVGSWVNITGPPSTDTDVDHSDSEPKPKSPVENIEGVLQWVICYSENHSHPNRRANNDAPLQIPIPAMASLPSLTQQDTMSTQSGNVGCEVTIRQENGTVDGASELVVNRESAQSEVETRLTPDFALDFAPSAVSTSSPDFRAESFFESGPESSTELSRSSAASSPSTPWSIPSIEISPPPEDFLDGNGDGHDHNILLQIHDDDDFSVSMPSPVISTMTASPPPSRRPSIEPDVSASRQREGDGGQTSNNGPIKRSLHQANSGHGNEDQVDTNQAKRKKTEDRPDQVLACPFYKKDPIQHKRCHGYVLTRIAYVKQHLFRHHVQPLHCPVCMIRFGDDESRDEHIRAQSCQKRPAEEQPDGMTPKQEKQLRAKRANQKQSEEEQWYEIFKLLFPDTERPSSPYLLNSLSKDMSSFREFVEIQGGRIVQDRLIDNLPSGVLEESAVRQLAYAAVQSIFPLWWNQSLGNYHQERVNSEVAKEAESKESRNKNGTEIHREEKNHEHADGRNDSESNGLGCNRNASNWNGGNRESGSNGSAGNNMTTSNGTQTSPPREKGAPVMSSLSKEAPPNTTSRLSHISKT